MIQHTLGKTTYLEYSEEQVQQAYAKFKVCHLFLIVYVCVIVLGSIVLKIYNKFVAVPDKKGKKHKKKKNKTKKQFKIKKGHVGFCSFCKVYLQDGGQLNTHINGKQHLSIKKITEDWLKQVPIAEYADSIKNEKEQAEKLDKKAKEQEMNKGEWQQVEGKKKKRKDRF